MDNGQPNPLAGLVPDYSTIDPAQVTAGQPALTPEETLAIQQRDEMERLGEIERQKLAGVGQPLLQVGPNPIGGLQRLMTPVAQSVAESDNFQPGIRSVAAEFAANQLNKQAQENLPPQQDPQIQAEMVANLNKLREAQGLPPIDAQASAAAPAPNESDAMVQELSSTPTVQDKIAAAEKFNAPARKAIAEQTAFERAQAELQKAQDEAEKRRAAVEQQITDMDTKASEEARVQSLPQIMQNGGFGSKLLAALAVTMGSVSQAYTGSKTNPALDVIDKAVESQAQKDKLRADQRLALQRELLDTASRRIDALKAMTQNEQAKQNLDLAKEELNLKRQDVQLKLNEALKLKSTAAGLYSGQPIDDATMATLKPEERAQVVNINGKRYMANNSDVAKKLNEEVANGNSALSKLKPYQQLVEKGGLATLGEKGVVGYYKDKKAADTLKVAIVGALRLPFTGPGILTDSEREMLINNIGNFGLFNLPFAEKEKLKIVVKDIQARMQSSADSAGIKAPIFAEKFVKTSDGRMMGREDYIDSISRRTGMSKEKISQALEKQGK